MKGINRKQLLIGGIMNRKARAALEAKETGRLSTNFRIRFSRI